MMDLKIVVKQCKEENGGYMSEQLLNDKVCPLDKALDFLGETAVKGGFNYTTRWFTLSRSNLGASFKTHQMDAQGGSLVWLEAVLSWPNGTITSEDVIKKITATF